MTTIEDLPFTVLWKILSYDWFGTAYRSAEVWPKIDYLLQKRGLYLSFQTNVDFITVKPVLQEYLWIEEGKDKAPYLIYGSTINRFLPDKLISVQSYNMLAESFVNLRELDVGWLNLEIFRQVGNWSNFPKLTKLSLGKPHGERTNQIKEYSDKEILNNLTGLIALLGRENYPKLILLSISIIFEETKENILVDSLLTFLSRHQKTLRYLFIFMARNPYYLKGDLTADWLTVPNFDVRLQSLTLNLFALVVHFYPYYESKKFLRLVDHVSLTQTSLQVHLVQFSPRFVAFYTDILEDNWKTLTCVNFNMWIFYTLDCRVFEQCSVLKTLVLYARPKKLIEFETENYRGERASSELVNIELLPKSLMRIKVVNFFIETKDAANFTTELPLLSELSLQGIGEKESLGITVTMFALLVHRGIVVGVYRGFNKQSIEEFQGSADDGAASFMNLFLSDKSNMLSLSVSKTNGNRVELAKCYRGILINNCKGCKHADCCSRMFTDGPPSNYKIYQGQLD